MHRDWLPPRLKSSCRGHYWRTPTPQNVISARPSALTDCETCRSAPAPGPVWFLPLATPATKRIQAPVRADQRLPTAVRHVVTTHISHRACAWARSPLKVAIPFSPIDQPQALTVNAPRPKAVEDQRSAGSEESRLREQLLLTRERIEELRGAFKGLNQSLRTGQASGASASRRASAASTADLGINAVATAATLQSSAEVNTTPTSFSTFGPDWADVDS